MNLYQTAHDKYSCSTLANPHFRTIKMISRLFHKNAFLALLWVIQSYHCLRRMRGKPELVRVQYLWGLPANREC